MQSFIESEYGMAMKNYIFKVVIIFKDIVDFTALIIAESPFELSPTSACTNKLRHIRLQSVLMIKNCMFFFLEKQT